MLDPRFTDFERTLFSVQSKSQDRSQLTTEQNSTLDSVIESFLGLLCPRVLLKPAVKALEWLIRRFRYVDYVMERAL